MTVVVEHLPVRPRKASASRRRRHVQQLPYRLHQIAPGAATILVTPIWTDRSGDGVRNYLARALDARGRILKFPAGGSQRIASLLQGAYPAADWDRPQTWNAASNALTTRKPLPNEERRAAVQRMEQQAAGLEAELAFQRERRHELAVARDFADSLASGYIDREGLAAS
ncbi:hypothetical protein [Streptomyces sp. NPDC101166]|uniref:hypothetical protein n=1 Tax=Streptomyces sp. NPDC101166 TaxID=3366120 RepID=UPI003815B2A0